MKIWVKKVKKKVPVLVLFADVYTTVWGAGRIKQFKPISIRDVLKESYGTHKIFKYFY